MEDSATPGKAQRKHDNESKLTTPQKDYTKKLGIGSPGTTGLLVKQCIETLLVVQALEPGGRICF